MRSLLTPVLAAGYVRVDETLVTAILAGLALTALLLAWGAWKLWTTGARPARDLAVGALLWLSGGTVFVSAFPGDPGWLWVAVPMLAGAAGLTRRVWRAGSAAQGRAAWALMALTGVSMAGAVAADRLERARMDAAEQEAALDDRWPPPEEETDAEGDDGTGGTEAGPGVPSGPP